MKKYSKNEKKKNWGLRMVLKAGLNLISLHRRFTFQGWVRHGDAERKILVSKITKILIFIFFLHIERSEIQ